MSTIQDIEKDFKEKANSFANWFTSVVVSNFVYLINFKEEKLWYVALDFFMTVFSLLFLFLFKVLGVWNARKKLDMKSMGGDIKAQEVIEKVEWTRTWIFFIGFVLAGMTAVLFSFYVIWVSSFSIRT